MANPIFNPDLPADIMEEVLVRLEPEQLGKFKVANKGFNDLISNKNFMKKHLQKMKDLNRGVFVLQPESSYAPLYYDNLEAHFATNGRVTTYDDKPAEVVAAGSGLILFCNLKDEFFLLNPSNRKSHQLPLNNIVFPDGCSWAQVIFGMGYLPTEDDYKIVRVALFNSPALNSEISIYSRNSGNWTRGPSFLHDIPMAQTGVCVHGCLHWRSGLFGKENSVISFNLSKFEFGYLKIPDVPLIFGVQQLVALDDETLALTCSVMFLGTPYIIWVLKDYFDSKSWTRINIDISQVIWSENIINLQPLSILKPNATKIIFRLDPVGVFGIYDMNEKEFSLLHAEEIEEGYCTVYGFVPSMHCPAPLH